MDIEEREYLRYIRDDLFKRLQNEFIGKVLTEEMYPIFSNLVEDFFIEHIYGERRTLTHKGKDEN